MSTCVVVIPIYKAVPKPSETASFKQCLSILKNYDIYIVTFEELDMSVYAEISETVGKAYKLKFFSKDYFTSVAKYNKLCLSRSFYDCFSYYDYMLIYQLDAWVFRDELQDWCNKGYDYIGAPQFYRIHADIHTKIFYEVGNGGFSLRNIQYCKNILAINRNMPYLRPSFLWKMYFTEEFKVYKKHNYISAFLIILFKVILKTFGYRNTLKYMIDSEKINEDYIFGCWAGHAWNIKTNIPSCEEASEFSFEVHPSFLYEKCQKLPFGCHAFEKWEYESFWGKYIKY